jgi:hypothetical protein
MKEKTRATAKEIVETGSGLLSIELKSFYFVEKMNQTIKCIDGDLYPAFCVIRVERYGDKFYGIYGEQLVAKDLHNYEIAKEASRIPLSQ